MFINPKVYIQMVFKDNNKGLTKWLRLFYTCMHVYLYFNAKHNYYVYVLSVEVKLEVIFFIINEKMQHIISIHYIIAVSYTHLDVYKRQ